MDYPNRVVPHSDQITFGYERQVGGTISASADSVHVFGRQLLMTQNLNMGSRATASATAPGGWSRYEDGVSAIAASISFVAASTTVDPLTRSASL